MPEKTWSEETKSIIDAKRSRKEVDGRLNKPELIERSTGIYFNRDPLVFKDEPWDRRIRTWTPGAHWIDVCQDTELFDKQINEKNIWFHPHIKYVSFEKNVPEFTFAEKIKLQYSLDQITKVSRIAKSYCAHAQSPKSLTDPMRRQMNPLHLPTSDKLLSKDHERMVKYVNRSCSGKTDVILITDLRDPYNPEIANKSYQDVITWEGTINITYDCCSVYVGSNFFRFGLTPQQRTLILYRSFLAVACYEIDDNFGAKSSLLEKYPECTDGAVLLFKEIQDALTLADEQSRVDKAAAEAEDDAKADARAEAEADEDVEETPEEKQARLNKAKAQKQRKQAKRLAAERSKGYTMFPAYDQNTSPSKTSKGKSLKMQ
jgi:hypothetical protein